MKKILIHSLIFVLLSSFIFVNGVLAQTSGETGGSTSGGSVDQTIKIQNPLTIGDRLTDILIAVLNNVVMPIAAVVAVMYIILAGFKYVTARGKPAEIQSANRNLLWALIGTGILLGAAGISRVLQNTVEQFIN